MKTLMVHPMIVYYLRINIDLNKMNRKIKINKDIPFSLLKTISCPTKRRDITVSPSSCTDKIPSALRAVFPSAANCRNFSAASFGIDKVTRTLFHGSTLNSKKKNELMIFGDTKKKKETKTTQ